MKIVKLILLGLVLLVALALITGLFIDNDYTVEREVTINKPKEQVFTYVKSLKNQNNYSAWALMEPTMKKEFRGTDGTVGFVSTWEGEDVGKGEQEIKKIVEGERIDYELRFEKPFEAVAQSHMSTEAVSGQQTKVKWGFTGHNSYPKNVMNGVMKWTLGNSLQQGLDSLKGILERGQVAEAE
jgi:uncharacterized protein YndB with AHSA1/START domain